MARNVELKARVRNWDRQCALAAQISDRPPVELVQEDTFFQVPRGRLKLRTDAAGSGELIYYERTDTAQARTSDYTRVPTPVPAALGAVLAQVLGVRGVVRKQRRLYLAGRTRIHLDDVEGLGRFLELEVVLSPDATVAAASAEAHALCAALEVDTADIVAGAYIDLLAPRTA